MQRNLLLLAALLSIEALAASLLLDGDTIQTCQSILAGCLRAWGAWTLRWVIGCALVFCAAGWLKSRPLVAELLAAPPRVSPPWLVLHTAALTAFAWLSSRIYGSTPARDLTVALWLAAAAATAASAALGFAPWTFWRRMTARTRTLAAAAAAASAAACFAGAWVQHLWEPAARLTFLLVRAMLSPFLSAMIVQPEVRRIGTSRFTVVISPECSGLEGMGLLLIFGALWLILFREELRFPRALLVLPAGAAALYLLNAARIAALALIGNAGFKEIALRGFHSQAGWIAFNAVALAILIAARRIPWLTVHPRSPRAAAQEYPALPYLAPLLAILAAGMVSRAMSAGFEWAYPLRLLAGLAALVYFRRHYQAIDWRCGWSAPLAGVAVFLLWIGFDWSAGNGAMPKPLEDAPGLWRLAWIAFRILGAVATVPIAEELAFRGFGLRRLISPDFEAVPWRAFHPLAIGASSAVFGMMHSGRWIEGTAAGAVYGVVMAHRGRLGDAAAAHAITNALLAAFVVFYGRWDLW